MIYFTLRGFIIHSGFTWRRAKSMNIIWKHIPSYKIFYNKYFPYNIVSKDELYLLKNLMLFDRKNIDRLNRLITLRNKRPGNHISHISLISNTSQQLSRIHVV